MLFFRIDRLLRTGVVQRGEHELERIDEGQNIGQSGRFGREFFIQRDKLFGTVFCGAYHHSVGFRQRFAVTVHMDEHDGDVIMQDGNDVFFHAGITTTVIRRRGRFFDERQFVFMAGVLCGGISFQVRTYGTEVRVVFVGIGTVQLQYGRKERKGDPMPQIVQKIRIL